MNRNRIVVLLLGMSLGFIVMLLARNLGRDDLVGGDEGYYGVMARNVAHGIAETTNPSLSPLGPPGDKPPLYPLLLAASLALGGIDEVPLRFVTLLVTATWAIFAGLIARRLHSPTAGVCAAFLCTFSPAIPHVGRVVHAEALLTALGLAAVHAQLRGLQTSRAAWSMVAGVLYGLAFLTKLWLVLPFALAGIGVLIANPWVSSRRDIMRHLGAVALPGILVASLQLALCALLTPWTLNHWLDVYFRFSLASRIAGRAYADYWLRPWSYYFIVLLRSISLIIPLVVFGVARLATRRSDRLGKLAVGFWLLPLVPMTLSAVKTGSYLDPFLPLMFVLAGIGLAELSGLPLARRLLWLSASIAVLLLIGSELLLTPDARYFRLMSPPAVLVSVAWTFCLCWIAFAPGHRRVAKAMLAGAIVMTAFAGISRDVQLARGGDHAIGYQELARRLAGNLADVPPDRLCFLAPEWPSLSFYTFRTGSYWDTPYQDPDSVRAIEALRGQDPFFFVTEVGTRRLYGGKPPASLRRAIGAEGEPLFIPLRGGEAETLRVFLNRRLAAGPSQPADPTK